ncbi:YdcH family protein [Roseateles sp. BYS96W]|uniref:YdcH family protein n=1 Tax=Pelomonas nitida TaxID=3299027 RepID=A0ABW7G0E8_9BURK
MNEQLHSLSRRLIELRMEHGDLDAMIDRLVVQVPVDELSLQRLKKRRLALRDMIARLEATTEPDDLA